MGTSATDRPDRVMISTFGFYAGIHADGRDTSLRHKSRTRELLEAMRKIPKVQILIGLHTLQPCKKNCAECGCKYVNTLIRHMNHVEEYPEFEWRIITDFNIKCALFFYSDPPNAKGVVGSRNFTDSSWEDVSLVLDRNGTVELSKHIDRIWNEARILTDKTVGNVIKEQEITDRAMEMVAAGL